MLSLSIFQAIVTIIYILVFCSGEFVVVNKHLLNDLTEMGIWSSTLKNKIIYEDGSILKIPEVPEHLKAIYKYNTILLHQSCGLLQVFFYMIK